MDFSSSSHEFRKFVGDDVDEIDASYFDLPHQQVDLFQQSDMTRSNSFSELVTGELKSPPITSPLPTSLFPSPCFHKSTALSSSASSAATTDDSQCTFLPILQQDLLAGQSVPMVPLEMVSDMNLNSEVSDAHTAPHATHYSLFENISNHSLSSAPLKMPPESLFEIIVNQSVSNSPSAVPPGSAFSFHHNSSTFKICSNKENVDRKRGFMHSMLNGDLDNKTGDMRPSKEICRDRRDQRADSSPNTDRECNLSNNAQSVHQSDSLSSSPSSVFDEEDYDQFNGRVFAADEYYNSDASCNSFVRSIDSLTSISNRHHQSSSINNQFSFQPILSKNAQFW